MATKNAERGTYTEEMLVPKDDPASRANVAEVAHFTQAKEGALSGELMPYTRVADLAPSLQLQDLTLIQGEDLLLWTYNKYHSSENDSDFLTIEVSFLGSPEQRFLVNCGGESAVAKVENAFAMVERKEAVGPLVAAFRKVPTANGRTFWTVS